MTTCNNLYEEALHSLQNPTPPREFMGKSLLKLTFYIENDGERIERIVPFCFSRLPRLAERFGAQNVS